MLTIPRSLFKSFTKDLSLPIFELVIQHRLTRLLRQVAVPLQFSRHSHRHVADRLSRTKVPRHPSDEGGAASLLDEARI
jgi:hypothetical protein